MYWIQGWTVECGVAGDCDKKAWERNCSPPQGSRVPQAPPICYLVESPSILLWGLLLTPIVLFRVKRYERVKGHVHKPAAAARAGLQVSGEP